MTLGGRSFGTTTSGTLPPPHLGAVRVNDGRLTVRLPTGNAALVTVGGRLNTPATERGGAQPASARGRSAESSAHERVLSPAAGPSQARRAVAIP